MPVSGCGSSRLDREPHGRRAALSLDHKKCRACPTRDVYIEGFAYTHLPPDVSHEDAMKSKSR